MDLTTVLESYADSVDGKFSSYNDDKAVVIVPVTDHRFQSIVATRTDIEDAEYIEIASKICSVEHMPEKLFWLQKEMNVGKLVVRDDFLLAVAYIDPGMDEKLIKAIINEVAYFADLKEKSLSGTDVF